MTLLNKFSEQNLKLKNDIRQLEEKITSKPVTNKTLALEREVKILRKENKILKEKEKSIKTKIERLAVKLDQIHF